MKHLGSEPDNKKIIILIHYIQHSVFRCEIRVEINTRLHSPDKSYKTQFRLHQGRRTKCMNIKEHESTKIE